MSRDNVGWLNERVRESRLVLLRTLRAHGPAHLDESTRILFGITRDPCEACGGSGSVWRIPDAVQEEMDAIDPPKTVEQLLSEIEARVSDSPLTDDQRERLMDVLVSRGVGRNLPEEDLVCGPRNGHPFRKVEGEEYERCQCGIYRRVDGYLVFTSEESVLQYLREQGRHAGFFDQLGEVRQIVDEANEQVAD